MKNIFAQCCLTSLFSALPLSTALGALINTVEGDPFGNLAGTTILYDFESGVAPVELTGDFTIYDIPSGTPTSAAPAFDESEYFLSVPNPESNGSANLTFATDMDYLGLYWGSVDTYNSITFYLNGNPFETITGSDVTNPASGNQVNPGQNLYVNITGIIFDEVQFSSTNYAFEIDNIAARPVPEPTAMLLMGAGIAGLVGFARRRKKR